MAKIFNLPKLLIKQWEKITQLKKLNTQRKISKMYKIFNLKINFTKVCFVLFFLLLFFETGPHYVIPAGLELIPLIHLSLNPETGLLLSH